VTDELLDYSAVAGMFPGRIVGARTLERRSRAGLFAPAIRASPRSPVFWRRTDVESWLAGKAGDQ
jgi:hypothetical protein